MVMNKSIKQLRPSTYHQQLGQKMCAAYIAQQQGITLETASQKVSEPVGDLWLMLAELARQWSTESGNDVAVGDLMRPMSSIM